MPYVLARPLVAVMDGLYNGTFAVWLFWILSAFVLSLQFFLRAGRTSGPSSHDYLEDALLRRYPRLVLPVIASVAFAYGIHRMGFMQNLVLANTLGEPYTSGWLSLWYQFPASLPQALKSSMWDTFFTFDFRSSYNPVLWTLEKEFFGSLFLFSFLGACGHRRSRVIVYPVMAVVLYMLRLHWLNAFVGGIALCDVYVNARLPPLHRMLQGFLPALRLLGQILVMVIWFILLMGVGLWNYFENSYLIIGMAMVALTLLPGVTQRVLSSRIPVFLGKISFGLYLVHMPLICSFSCWAYLAIYLHVGALPAAVMVSAVTCLLSVALGYLLYVLADRPGMIASRRISAFIMGVGRRPL